ncbi:MAG: PEP-utilizing enzyme [Parcubacteria group bacterium]
MSQNSPAYKICQQALKEKWYIQGFNGLPIFLNHAGLSAFEMKKYLGYEYTKMFLDFQHNYCEVGYLWTDLERIWRTVKGKLADDRNYLRNVKHQYNKVFEDCEQFFSKVTRIELKKLSDDELVTTLQQSGAVMMDSVGVGHIIEAVGMGLEKDFKQQLRQVVEPGEKFNQCLTALTAPTRPSFLTQEEWELAGLAHLKPSQREKALTNHAAQYFWLSNSYARIRELSTQYFARRLATLTGKKLPAKIDINKEKAALIGQLNLDKDTKKNINLIDFTTIWQDERKANIMKVIGCFDRVIKEMSRRTKISKQYLYYLGVKDIEEINSLVDLKLLAGELETRSQGVFFLRVGQTEHILSGQSYSDLRQYRDKLENETQSSERELHGSVAMTGTAIGRAVICQGLSSLAKVRPGDIIVASMTRPEFMPALRKAAGIVTDEGGITCHAAIIARELNIPTVIGTKRATKVFKDGAMIEVRANHGIVRELK